MEKILQKIQTLQLSSTQKQKLLLLITFMLHNILLFSQDAEIDRTFLNNNNNIKTPPVQLHENYDLLRRKLQTTDINTRFMYDEQYNILDTIITYPDPQPHPFLDQNSHMCAQVDYNHFTFIFWHTKGEKNMKLRVKNNESNSYQMHDEALTHSQYVIRQDKDKRQRVYDLVRRELSKEGIQVEEWAYPKITWMGNYLREYCKVEDDDGNIETIRKRKKVSSRAYEECEQPDSKEEMTRFFFAQEYNFTCWSMSLYAMTQYHLSQSWLTQQQQNNLIGMMINESAWDPNAISPLGAKWLTQRLESYRTKMLRYYWNYFKDVFWATAKLNSKNLEHQVKLVIQYTLDRYHGIKYGERRPWTNMQLTSPWYTRKKMGTLAMKYWWYEIRSEIPKDILTPDLVLYHQIQQLQSKIPHLNTENVFDYAILTWHHSGEGTFPNILHRLLSNRENSKTENIRNLLEQNEVHEALFQLCIYIYENKLVHLFWKDSAHYTQQCLSSFKQFNENFRE